MHRKNIFHVCKDDKIADHGSCRAEEGGVEDGLHLRDFAERDDGRGGGEDRREEESRDERAEKLHFLRRREKRDEDVGFRKHIREEHREDDDANVVQDQIFLFLHVQHAG